MSDVETAHATADAHDEAAGHGHEPPAEPLGPVDVNAWLYAIGGGAVGVVVALALFVAGGA